MRPDEIAQLNIQAVTNDERWPPACLVGKYYWLFSEYLLFPATHSCFVGWSGPMRWVMESLS